MCERDEGLLRALNLNFIMHEWSMRALKLLGGLEQLQPPLQVCTPSHPNYMFYVVGQGELSLFNYNIA